MDLDFTKLDSIGTSPYKALETPFQYEAENLTMKVIKPSETSSNGSEKGCDDGLINVLEDEIKRREKTRQAYKHYQQNIRRAGTLRGEILKGIQSGEAPLELLLKALECIYLMTDDSAGLQQSREDLITVYGYGLGEQAPLKVRLAETKDRLTRLTRPELEEQLTPAEREHLQTAIKAHRSAVDRIEKLLENSQTGSGK